MKHSLQVYEQTSGDSCLFFPSPPHHLRNPELGCVAERHTCISTDTCLCRSRRQLSFFCFCAPRRLGAPASASVESSDRPCRGFFLVWEFAVSQKVTSGHHAFVHASVSLSSCTGPSFCPRHSRTSSQDRICSSSRTTRISQRRRRRRGFLLEAGKRTFTSSYEATHVWIDDESESKS